MTRNNLQDLIEESLIHVGNNPGRNTRIEVGVKLIKAIDAYVSEVIGKNEIGGYESTAERNELRAEQRERANL